MVEGRWYAMGTDISLPLSLRQEIFARGRDTLDDAAWQVLVYDGDTPAGIARLWWQDGAFQIGDLGVLPQFRGRGYGDLLVRLCLFKALTHAAREIALRSPAETVPFFARYHFAVEGDGEMIPMRILAKDVELGHCQGCAGK